MLDRLIVWLLRFVARRLEKKLDEAEVSEAKIKKYNRLVEDMERQTVKLRRRLHDRSKDLQPKK